MTGNGVILTASTFAGGMTNSGTVAASISATNSADAFGLQLIPSTFIGDLANSGVISAIAADTGTGAAQADGIVLSAATIVGSFVNSGTVAASATGMDVINAIGVSISNPGVMIYGPAGAATGNFSNAGKIMTTATATAGSADATEIVLSVETLVGNFINSGTVVTTANATGTATATGVDISTSSFGSILNYTPAGGTTGG